MECKFFHSIIYYPRTREPAGCRQTALTLTSQVPLTLIRQKPGVVFCLPSEESTPKTEGTAKAAHGLYKWWSHSWGIKESKSKGTPPLFPHPITAWRTLNICLNQDLAPEIFFLECKHGTVIHRCLFSVVWTLQLLNLKWDYITLHYSYQNGHALKETTLT